MKTKTLQLLGIAMSLTITSCALGTSSTDSQIDKPYDPNSSDTQVDVPVDPGQSGGTTADANDPYAGIVEEKTIRDLINLGKVTDNTHLYKITGVVQYVSSPNYGNFDIIDSTGDIFVYGCTAKYSAITKSGSNYSFSNDKTFKNTGVKQGDTVTLIGMYKYYTYSSGSYGYPEFMGYVYQINGKSNYKLEASSYDESLETYTGNYYSDITATSGLELGKQLHNLMDSTHKNYNSYDSLYTHWQSTGEYSGGQYKCIYSGNNYAKSNINREHVWPQSHSNNLWGKTYGGSDILHLRPSYKSYNSARSNSPFGEIIGSNIAPRSISYAGGGASRYASHVFEPADAVKGDIARILMYVYVHYSTDFGGNTKSYYADLTLGDVLAPYYDDQCYKLLRKWNALDPVSEQEKKMNDYVYSTQGNRNPFIDRPSYADLIFGAM